MRSSALRAVVGVGTSVVFLSGCGTLGGLLPSNVEVPAELEAARAVDNLVNAYDVPAAAEREPVTSAADIAGCWASRVPDEDIPVPETDDLQLRTGAINVVVFDFDAGRLSQQSLIRAGGGLFEFVYLQEGPIGPPVDGEMAAAVDTIGVTALTGQLETETFDPIPGVRRVELTDDGLLVVTLIDPNDPSNASDPTVFQRMDCP